MYPYQQISKDTEPKLLLLWVRFIEKFLVEDLIFLKSDSQNTLTLISKLLNNISNKHKGFVNAVDSRGLN